MEEKEEIRGILLKTRPKYAKTFIENWNETKKPQVFCIYDRRPILKHGDVVLVYINGLNRLGFYATFIRSEWVRGFKIETEETRIRERERIWKLFGNKQLHTNDKKEFDNFWKQQAGVRSFVIIEDLKEIKNNIKWKDLMKILYTNYPRGVGFIYVTNLEIKKIMELIEK